MYFKVNPMTKLGKLFQAYLYRSNLSINSFNDVSFSVRDRELFGTETPDQLGLEDGDVIYITCRPCSGR